MPNIKNALKLFSKTLIPRKDQVELFENFPDLDNKSFTSEQLLSKQDPLFDFHQFIFRTVDIDEPLAEYARVLKTFDQVVSRLDKLPLDFDCDSDIDDRFIDEYVKLSLKRNQFKSNERIISFLKEEMEKHGIEFNMARYTIRFFYSIYEYTRSKWSMIFNNFMQSKTLMFLLTEKYYRSKKFEKVFEAAKRTNKNIFLVKLQEFDLNIREDYKQLYVHDISKNEDCGYEGSLGRQLIQDVAKCCSLKMKVSCLVTV